MTTFQIVTLDTLTYDEEESAKAFAVVEWIASLAGSVLKLRPDAAMLVTLIGRLF
jgi:hypothetical protein